MTNLVPKPLVDKNGVRTTRMVRESASSSSRTAFPPPNVPVTWANSKAAAEDIVAIASKGMWNNYDGQRVDHSQTVMDKLGYEGVHLVREKMANLSEEDAFKVGQLLMPVLRDREFGPERLESTCTMIDAEPVARLFGPPENPRFLINNLVLLHSAVREEGVRFDDPTSDNDRSVVRYLTFRMCMGVYPATSDSKNEARWFDENFDALVPYADLIRERGADLGLLKELVSEGNVAPLATGLL